MLLQNTWNKALLIINHVVTHTFQKHTKCIVIQCGRDCCMHDVSNRLKQNLANSSTRLAVCPVDTFRQIRVGFN